MKIKMGVVIGISCLFMAAANVVIAITGGTWSVNGTVAVACFVCGIILLS